MIVAGSLRYRALAIDDLAIGPGTTSVIGPNGSGKTTLLRLLAGLAVPDAGTILIDGVPPRETATGWVNEFPDRNILFRSVADEIASPLRFRHLPCRETADRVRSCMDSLGICHLGSRELDTLSGGEKVLVALAAALVTRPQVLVLDEYDSHLDAGRSDEIARVIRMSGTPYIIHCTQDMESAASGDAVICLEEGKVRAAGTPENVFGPLLHTAYYPLSWRCRG